MFSKTSPLDATVTEATSLPIASGIVMDIGTALRTSSDCLAGANPLAVTLIE
jgi:hypothetical protein